MKAHCPRSEATFERQRHTDRTIPNVSRPTDFVFSSKRTNIRNFIQKYDKISRKPTLLCAYL